MDRGMRRGALISFIVHLAIVVAAIVTLPPLKLDSSADESVSVDLVGPSTPQQANAPGKVPAIVLASATPALETRVNAETGRYRWLRLPSRFGAARMPEIATVDLVRTLPRIDVPVVMAQGRRDQVAPGEAAERYASSLRAPGKELVWFENSAHTPHLEEPDQFRRLLMRVRANIQGDAYFTQVSTGITLPAGNPLGVPATIASRRRASTVSRLSTC